MIAIRINKAGEVIAVRYNVMRLKDGEIAVDAIPNAPKVGQYETATMVLIGGKIGYRIDALPEPIPEPEEPKPPTEEELSEERRLAYEAEADRYLIAMHGYEVEGKEQEAENCRKAYLAKKAEIRKRFS